MIRATGHVTVLQPFGELDEMIGGSMAAPATSAEKTAAEHACALLTACRLYVGAEEGTAEYDEIHTYTAELIDEILEHGDVHAGKTMIALCTMLNPFITVMADTNGINPSELIANLSMALHGRLE